jgi:hypothetical protein
LVVLKTNQESSLPDNKGLVTDPNEELVAELDILRGEMATLIQDLRRFAGELRKNPWESVDVADELESIING